MNFGELIAKGGALFLRKKLSAIQAVYDAAPAGEKAAFQASVSGDRAALNAAQQAQQAAGATTALLSADKSALLDPGGGPALNIRRYIKVGTLAEVLAVTGTYGDGAIVTNLGASGSGVLVRYGAGGWRITEDQTLSFDKTLAYSAATTSEVVVKQVTLPAGFSALMSGLRIEMGWQKSGATTAATQCRLRIGASGTISDTNVVSTASLAAGNRSISGARTFHFGTSSTLQNSGNQGLAGIDFGYSASNIDYPLTWTVNNTATTDTKISLCMQLAATTDQPGAYLLKVVGLS